MHQFWIKTETFKSGVTVSSRFSVDDGKNGLRFGALGCKMRRLILNFKLPPPPPPPLPQAFEHLKVGALKFPPPGTKIVFKCPTLSAEFYCQMPLPKTKEQMFLVQTSLHDVTIYYKTRLATDCKCFLRMNLLFERGCYHFTVSFLSLFNGCSRSADSNYFMFGKLSHLDLKIYSLIGN